MTRALLLIACLGFVKDDNAQSRLDERYDIVNYLKKRLMVCKYEGGCKRSEIDDALEAVINGKHSAVPQ